MTDTARTQPRLIDAKGLFCPMPILRLAAAVRRVDAGELFEVHATDPAFVADVRAWCEATGHLLLVLEQTPTFHRALIRRAQKSAGQR